MDEWVDGEEGEPQYPDYDWNNPGPELAKLRDYFYHFQAPRALDSEYQVPQVNIHVMGVPGAGKSSWINTVFASVRGRICHFAVSGSEVTDGTMTRVLNAYKVRGAGGTSTKDASLFPFLLVPFPPCSRSPFPCALFRAPVSSLTSSDWNLLCRVFSPSSGLRRMSLERPSFCSTPRATVSATTRTGC